MIELTNDDKSTLLRTLISVPNLAKERDREATFITAGLEELIPLIEFSGPSSTFIPIMLRRLCTYGRLTYDHEALGRLLNTLKSYVGIEEADFFDNIISKYNMMVPIAKSFAISDWKTPVNSKELIEKIIGENTLRPMAFIQKALNASRSVAYIEVSSDGIKKWSGTGFLISPSLLLTNHHVLENINLASRALFRFNYQIDVNGNPEISKDYTTNDVYYSNESLDYAIVGLKDDPGNEWGYLKYSINAPSNEDRVNIIQHPNGLPKQISVQNNFVKYIDNTKIQYLTSTSQGSSGSPVFNDNWEVVGIHHAGGWIPEKEESPVYFRNEGILMKAIIADLPSEIKGKLAIGQ